MSRYRSKRNSFGATLARLGGDEFAAIIIGHYTRTDIREFCVQLVGACGRPVLSGGEELRLTISQSIAWNSTYGLNLKLGLNVSPKQFDDDAFIGSIRGMISVPDFEPGWIDIAITENKTLIDQVSQKFQRYTISKGSHYDGQCNRCQYNCGRRRNPGTV